MQAPKNFAPSCLMGVIADDWKASFIFAGTGCCFAPSLKENLLFPILILARLWFVIRLPKWLADFQLEKKKLFSLSHSEAGYVFLVTCILLLSKVFVN